MSTGKVWFITGASRGFGRLWAEAALQRGDKVVATARDTASLQILADCYGDAVLPLPLDVTAVQKGHAHFGHLDVVVSNAGYGLGGTVEELDLDDVRTQFETNVYAARIADWDKWADASGA
ncbi:SDR family NAD(P)-dependent oxidoreductase [Pseudomonas sp. X10]